jgi:hypothetical protein
MTTLPRIITTSDQKNEPEIADRAGLIVGSSLQMFLPKLDRFQRQLPSEKRL